MKLFLRTLTASVLAAHFAFGAHAATPPACAELTPAKFQSFSDAIDAAYAANALAIAAPGVSVVDIKASLDYLSGYWADAKMPWKYDADPSNPLKAFDLTKDNLIEPTRTNFPDLTGSVAPYASAVLGYEASSRAGHGRYWASIGVFYNRADSPQANLISANGKTTHALVRESHAATEKINRVAKNIAKLATQCMDQLSW